MGYKRKHERRDLNQPQQGFVRNETLFKPLGNSKDLDILYLQGIHPSFSVPNGCLFQNFLEDPSRLASHSQYTLPLLDRALLPGHFMGRWLTQCWLILGQLSISDLINQEMGHTLLYTRSSITKEFLQQDFGCAGYSKILQIREIKPAGNFLGQN